MRLFCCVGLHGVMPWIRKPEKTAICPPWTFWFMVNALVAVLWLTPINTKSHIGSSDVGFFIVKPLAVFLSLIYFFGKLQFGKPILLTPSLSLTNCFFAKKEYNNDLQLYFSPKELYYEHWRSSFLPIAPPKCRLTHLQQSNFSKRSKHRHGHRHRQALTRLGDRW